MKFLLLLSLFLCGCTTRFVEKQSEELSKVVYATSDSIDAGRFDLAEKYSKETTKLVVPPKQRIEVKPIYD